MFVDHFAEDIFDLILIMSLEHLLLSSYKPTCFFDKCAFYSEPFLAHPFFLHHHSNDLSLFIDMFKLFSISCFFLL